MKTEKLEGKKLSDFWQVEDQLSDPSVIAKIKRNGMTFQRTCWNYQKLCKI